MPSLPKDRFIRKQSEFNRHFKLSSRYHATSFVLYAAPATKPETRLALVVSKKVSKKAVVRNKMRARLRELYRCHQHEIKSDIDLIIIAKPAIAQTPFTALESEWLKTLATYHLAKIS